jgi:hypothetical protein
MVVVRVECSARFHPMPTDRSKMTVRVVPRGSAESGEARVEGTVAERLELVARLSEDSWARTRRSLPTYTRATMPVVITPLGARSSPD